MRSSIWDQTNVSVTRKIKGETRREFSEGTRIMESLRCLRKHRFLNFDPEVGV